MSEKINFLTDDQINEMLDDARSEMGDAGYDYANAVLRSRGLMNADKDKDRTNLWALHEEFIDSVVKYHNVCERVGLHG